MTSVLIQLLQKYTTPSIIEESYLRLYGSVMPAKSDVGAVFPPNDRDRNHQEAIYTLCYYPEQSFGRFEVGIIASGLVFIVGLI